MSFIVVKTKSYSFRIVELLLAMVICLVIAMFFININRSPVNLNISSFRILGSTLADYNSSFLSYELSNGRKEVKLETSFPKKTVKKIVKKEIAKAKKQTIAKAKIYKRKKLPIKTNIPLKLPVKKRMLVSMPIVKIKKNPVGLDTSEVVKLNRYHFKRFKKIDFSALIAKVNNEVIYIANYYNKKDNNRKEKKGDVEKVSSVSASNDDVVKQVQSAVQKEARVSLISPKKKEVIARRKEQLIDKGQQGEASDQLVFYDYSAASSSDYSTSNAKEEMAKEYNPLITQEKVDISTAVKKTINREITKRVDSSKLATPRTISVKKSLDSQTRTNVAYPNRGTFVSGQKRMASQGIEKFSKQPKQSLDSQRRLAKDRASIASSTVPPVAYPDEDKLNKLMAASQKIKNADNEKNFSRGTIKDVLVSVNTVMISEAVFGKGIGQKLTSFEFVPIHSDQEIYYDRAEGFITVSRRLNETVSVLRGTIAKANKIQTKINLVMEDGDFVSNIPLFDNRQFAQFLDKNDANGPGGFIILELGNDAIEADIDKQYVKKFYLDNKLRLVTNNSDAQYLLFAGAEPGNTLLTLKAENGQFANKIIHVVEDEIFFENCIINEGKAINFSLFQKEILSNQVREINLASADIRYFNTNIEASSKGINNFSINIPPTPLGMRKYYELNHLEKIIYVGHGDNSRIELPGQDMINYIMDVYDITSLNNSCLVQINLSLKAYSFNIEGETAKGPMGVDAIHLDSDGTIGEDITEKTKNIFILGSNQGLINIFIKYFDGSFDSFQTYCSAETYLVEQL